MPAPPPKPPKNLGMQTPHEKELAARTELWRCLSELACAITDFVTLFNNQLKMDQLGLQNEEEDDG